MPCSPQLHKRAAMALLAVAVGLSTSAAVQARSASFASFKGPGHTGGLPRTVAAWAAAPRPYTLGGYSAARGTQGTPHAGTSTLRQQHVQRLQTCNPFAGVRAAAPLAPC